MESIGTRGKYFIYGPYDFLEGVHAIMTDADRRVMMCSKSIGEIIRIGSFLNENANSLLKGLQLDQVCSEELNNGQTINYYMNAATIEMIGNINKLIKEYEIVFEKSSAGIFITDGEGNVLNVNPEDERKCMMTREQMIGKNVKDLVDSNAFNPSTVQKVIETGKTSTITQTTKNGQKVICTGTPILDERGKISVILCNNVDYTEMIELKQNLELSERLQKYYKTHMNSNNYRKFLVEDFYASSQEMLNILDLIDNMAEIDPTVFISGKTGVGKSVIAKKIHMNSPRKSENFIEINCGAIPANLLESELFGYTKGAFTGASAEGKVGLIELANNGTLFLDEIGDMPLDLQVKLLHVIQNKTLRRVGSTKEIKVNVRIISASNKDLTNMIKDGSFRSDLYYRLNVIPIHVPSLSERKEEIPDLLALYLNVFNERYSMKKRLHPETINNLMNYEWPGNIRELINIVERLMVTSASDTIMPETLPPEIRSNRSIEIDDQNLNLDRILYDVERDIIIKALEKTRNSYEIARLLGIGQSSVIRKLQKYNLNSFLSGHSK